MIRTFVVSFLSIKKRKRQVTARRYVTLSIVVKSCIEVQYAKTKRRNASREYRRKIYMLSRFVVSLSRVETPRLRVFFVDFGYNIERKSEQGFTNLSSARKS